MNNRLPCPVSAGARRWLKAFLAGCTVFAVSGCQQADDVQPVAVRPVRTVTVELAERPVTMNFTGRIEAQDQPSLAFRIAGRIAERPVSVGTRLEAGDVVARLDPKNELNALRSSEATLAAAESSFRQADGHYQRQSRLRARGVASDAVFEEAEQKRKAARAGVDASRAQLRSAEHVVGFTTLRADAPGVVTAIGAEPGEVVSAGRMVVQLAREGGKDAIFNVPAEFLRAYPEDVPVSVSLSGDPSQRVAGRIREISPQADPVTRTFRIRVGLTSPPPSFRLGATVTGLVSEELQGVMTIPAGALITRERSTVVWVVEPGTMTVATRSVELKHSDPATAIVTKGLAPGDIVVTAGANLLSAGQKVRLIGTEL